VATRGSPTRGGKGIFLARPAEKETGIKKTDRRLSTFFKFLFIKRYFTGILPLL
jgi:hypothetical protein